MKDKKIFYFCLIFSLFMHVSFISFIKNYKFKKKFAQHKLFEESKIIQFESFLQTEPISISFFMESQKENLIEPI